LGGEDAKRIYSFAPLTQNVRRIYMTHSVLLYVEEPTYNTDETLNWKPFREKVGIITRSFVGTETLGENCWLIPLRNDLGNFASLVYEAQFHKLRYRVLFLEEEPVWIHPSSTTGKKSS
jgi:hypothetical protein